MGSAADFEANVSISFTIKQTEANSEKDINQFLEDHKLEFTDRIDEVDEDLVKKLYEDNTEFELENQYDRLADSGSNTIEEALDVFNDYHDYDNFYITTIRPVTLEELKYINLDIIKTFSVNRLDKEFRHSEQIVATSGEIYCDSDNEYFVDVDVKDVKKLLSMPEAKIELTASGNTY